MAVIKPCRDCGRPAYDSDYCESCTDPDPYSTCVKEIKRCLMIAFNRSGAMSQDEFQSLMKVEEVLRNLDNS